MKGVTTMQNEWININKETPEDDERCLVHLSNGHICIGFYTSETFWSTGYYVNTLEVTHWMPLPEPPKGE